MSFASLPQLSGKRVVRALERAGFVARRQRGSHAILVHSEDLTRRAVVPLHGSKPVKAGTLRAILKGVAIPPEEFKELL